MGKAAEKGTSDCAPAAVHVRAFWSGRVCPVSISFCCGRVRFASRRGVFRRSAEPPADAADARREAVDPPIILFLNSKNVNPLSAEFSGRFRPICAARRRKGAAERRLRGISETRAAQGGECGGQDCACRAWSGRVGSPRGAGIAEIRRRRSSPPARFADARPIYGFCVKSDALCGVVPVGGGQPVRVSSASVMSMPSESPDQLMLSRTVPRCSMTPPECSFSSPPRLR